MSWTCRRIKVALMTLDALCRRPLVPIVGMATDARDGRMCARERETRRVVVKRCGTPGLRCVARCAGGRKPGRCVGGIRRRRVVPLMALVALRGSIFELVSLMASRAGNRRMGTREGKTRGRMVELSAPAKGINGVAFNAIGSKTHLRMRRRQCGRVLLPVTGITIGRSPPVFIPLLVDMAIPAGRTAVRAKEGKSRLGMPLGHIGNQPALRAVTALACGTQFTAVNVVVTVFALPGHAPEFQ